jgi:hypothetical protein
MGAPILVEPSASLSNPIDIAIKELEMGILPMTIRRTLPDGTHQVSAPPLLSFLEAEVSCSKKMNWQLGATHQ